MHLNKLELHVLGTSSEHPGLVEDVPTHGRGVGTRRSLRSLPTQTILWFYDSKILTFSEIYVAAAPMSKKIHLEYQW